MRCPENLAVLGTIADLLHTEDTVSLHDFRPTEHIVRWESSLLVEVGLVRALAADRFARKRRLVNMKGCRLKQYAVGRHFRSCLQQNNVAHDNLSFRNLRRIAVTDYLHRFVIIYLVEDSERLVGSLLKEESHPCSKENGNENASRFEKDFIAFVQSVVLIERDADGKKSGDEQDNNQRIAELSQETLPQRGPRCWRKEIFTIFLPTVGNLPVGKS